MTMDHGNNDILATDESYDRAMEADTRSEAEIHADELRARVREDGYAVEVVRHDAAGRETERFFAGHFITAVDDETSRCSGRSNCYSEVSQFIPGERGNPLTDCFAKIGPSGVLGLAINKRTSHVERMKRAQRDREAARS